MACAQCEKELTRKARGPAPTYCSAACRQKAYAQRKKRRDAIAQVIIPCPWCPFRVTAEYLVGPYVMSMGEEESIVKLLAHARDAHARIL